MCSRLEGFSLRQGLALTLLYWLAARTFLGGVEPEYNVCTSYSLFPRCPVPPAKFSGASPPAVPATSP